MFHIVWCFMVAISVVFAAIRGHCDNFVTQMLEGAQDAVSLTIRLAAAYAFFCGWMELMQGLRVPQGLTRTAQPLLRRLFPSVQGQATKNAIAMNFTANILGLGNAATPTGMEAMRLMSEENGGGVSDAMKLFLVINATSIQLLPTTVIALRAAAGSANPSAIVLPTLLCTTVSTVTGSLAALLCGRRYERR